MAEKANGRKPKARTGPELRYALAHCRQFKSRIRSECLKWPPHHLSLARFCETQRVPLRLKNTLINGMIAPCLTPCSVQRLSLRPVHRRPRRIRYGKAAMLPRSSLWQTCTLSSASGPFKRRRWRPTRGPRGYHIGAPDQPHGGNLAGFRGCWKTAGNGHEGNAQARAGYAGGFIPLPELGLYSHARQGCLWPLRSECRIHEPSKPARLSRDIRISGWTYCVSQRLEPLFSVRCHRTEHPPEYSVASAQGQFGRHPRAGR